jgi:hypothetical protein
MKPSTGAAVRLHRNAVRDRPESLSAFKRNACPPSPEYPFITAKTYFGPDRRRNVNVTYGGEERRKRGNTDIIKQQGLFKKVTIAI